MAVFEVEESQAVGKYVRARAREFEEKHAPVSVFLTDQRGMWDLRITYGERSKGVAYISAPDAGGKVARIRWPGGDIVTLRTDQGVTLDGFIIEALKNEEEWLTSQSGH